MNFFLGSLQRNVFSSAATDRVIEAALQSPFLATVSGLDTTQTNAQENEVRSLCHSAFESTLRSTLSFQRDGVERARTLIAQRIQGLRTCLSM